MLKHNVRFWLLRLATVGLVGTTGHLALTQPGLTQNVITPDATLGVGEGSLVNPLDADTDVIRGGATRGQNLFHSFEEFNVGEGFGALFLSPAGLENIFSRVTGSNPSNIFGMLGTTGEGTPNLYFINPNGIIFGPNSSLAVEGSFTATTANAIQFGENGFFSATDPENPSQILTINPSAFFFSQLNPTAKIENFSRADSGRDPADLYNTFGLRVPDGQSITFLGGNITIDGGGIVAFGGRIELGGLAEEGVVNLNSDASFSFSESGLYHRFGHRWAS